MSYTIGIDLGTTNSVVAVLEGAEPTVVPNAEGSRTTASVVAFSRTGDTLVGEVAKRQAVTNADRTVRSVKRHMGTDWTLPVDGKEYTAPELSARILGKLKRDAEAYLGGPVTGAVITVPAYFDDAQRTATKEAGRIAGLEVLRIVNEPTAAALAYGLDHPDGGRGDGGDQTVLVFDLGGGTFDVSVLSIGDGVFEVLATAGDTSLGGDDFDRAVIDWLVRSFRDDHGVDLSADAMALQRLKEAAEKAKCELSQVATTTISLPFVTATDAGPLHLEYELGRARFEELVADIVERCRAPFERVLADAGLRAEDVDHVVLVGGSTRVPAVRRLVVELAGREPHQGVNPDEVVAAGAAIQAGVLTGSVSDVLLLDVTPLSLGIETRGGVMTRLIERNTTIPTRRSEVFTTAADGQASVEVHVLQGEREMADGNTTLGRFSLDGIAPAPAGEPQVEVTFDIDANGIVNVTARDRATGAEQSVTITGRSSLTRDQIDAMVRDAETHVARDRERREEAEVRNAGEVAERRLASALADATGAPVADTKAAEAALDELRAALAGGEVARVRTAAEVAARAHDALAAAADRGAGDGIVDAEVVDAEIVE